MFVNGSVCNLANKLTSKVGAALFLQCAVVTTPIQTRQIFVENIECFFEAVGASEVRGHSDIFKFTPCENRDDVVNRERTSETLSVRECLSNTVSVATGKNRHIQLIVLRG